MGIDPGIVRHLSFLDLWIYTASVSAVQFFVTRWIYYALSFLSFLSLGMLSTSSLLLKSRIWNAGCLTQGTNDLLLGAKEMLSEAAVVQVSKPVRNSRH